MKRKDVHQGRPVLLDTHVWIWYAGDIGGSISADLLQLLEDCDRCVSDISYWEIAVKSGKGALEFSIDPTVWLNRATRAPAVRMLPLDREILLLGTRLSGSLHADPADCLLIATSILHDAPLVTADSLILDYGARNPALTVIDARH